MASLSLPSQDLNIDIPDVGEVFVDPNDPFLSSAFIRTPEGFATINFQAIGEQKGFKGDEAILQGRNAFLGQIGIDPEAQFKNIRNTKSVTGTSGITIKTRNLADFHQGLFTQFGVGPDTLSKVQKQYGSDIQGFIGAIQSTPKGGGNITREVSPINPQGVVVSVDGKEVRSSPSIEQTLQAGGASVQQAKQLAGVAQAGQPFTPQQLAGAGYQTPQSQVTGPGQQFKTVTDPLTGKVSSAITGSPQVGQQGQMTPQQIQQGIDTAKTKAGEIQTGIDRLKAQGVNGTPSGQALANTFNQKASDVIRNMEATLASSLLKEEQDVTKIEDKIESILKGRKGPTQLLKEEFERRGITAQQNILKEFDKRIKAMNKEIRDIPENLQKTLEDVGVTQAQLNRLSMRDTQKSMRVLTDFMEERNAFADEVNEAVGFAQQFVGSVLEDQANHLALLEWQLNREEADVAELKAEQKELTRQALADRKEIMQLALDAINSGLEQSVIDDILEADSIDDAISTFGQAMANAPAGANYQYFQQGGQIIQVDKNTGQAQVVHNGRTDEKEDIIPGTSSVRTQQVLDGFTSIADMTPSEQQKVRDDLFALGFNSDTPPDWFQKLAEENAQQSLLPDVIKQMWEDYRKQIMGSDKAGANTTEDGDVESLIKEFPDKESKIREAINAGFSIEEIRAELEK